MASSASGVRRGSAGLAAGIWLVTVPAWLIGTAARSAELIDPGGRAARGWRVALVLAVGLTVFHVLAACARGGRLRHFFWPFGHPFWVVRRLREGGLYTESRDAFWAPWRRSGCRTTSGSGSSASPARSPG